MNETQSTQEGRPTSWYITLIVLLVAVPLGLIALSNSYFFDTPVKVSELARLTALNKNTGFKPCLMRHIKRVGYLNRMGLYVCHNSYPNPVPSLELKGEKQQTFLQSDKG